MKKLLAALIVGLTVLSTANIADAHRYRCVWVPGHYNYYGYWIPGHKVCYFKHRHHRHHRY